jgi:hypothetical protein
MLSRRPDDGAASTSETSVNFYQTTRRNNPEDSHFHFPHSFVSNACNLRSFRLDSLLRLL